jgi:hypothetical protein
VQPELHLLHWGQAPQISDLAESCLLRDWVVRRQF